MDNTVFILCIWGSALLFLCIGIYAGRRKDPMWFWSGSYVPRESITNVRAYNRENARMWKLYSIPFWFCGVLYFLQPSIALILLAGACTIGLAWLIITYRKIETKYKNPNW